MAYGPKTVPKQNPLPPGFLRGPAGPTPEEAKAAMISSAEAAKTFVNKDGKVPSFIAEERAKIGSPMSEADGVRRGGNAPVAQPPIQADVEDAIIAPVAERQAAAPVSTAAPVAQDSVPIPANVERVAATPATTEDETYRAETTDYVRVIFFDKKNRVWVAEVTYTNGSGTERFSDHTQLGLLAKLADGKANSTLKIRKDQNRIQRLKLGNDFESWDIFWEKAYAMNGGITQDEYSKLPAASRALIEDAVQATYVQDFLLSHLDYYRTQENWLRIVKYLNKHKVPMTEHNLDLVYYDLTEDEALDTKPSIQATEVVSTPAPVVEVVAPVSVMMETPVVADSTPAPVPASRKRGFSGIVPGSSSAVSTPAAPAETGTSSEQLSVEQVRQLGSTPEGLKRLQQMQRRKSL